MGVKKAYALHQYWQENWTGFVDDRVIVFCAGIGIILGICIDAYVTHNSQPIVYVAEAATIESVEQEVKIKIAIDWTKERIIQEIEKTFPEDPATAIKIAKCESELDADIQSYHINSQGNREPSFGIFQIHSPDWHNTAIRLGYENYKTDPGDNIAMARYIYEQAGKRWTDWSCYTKKMI